MAEKIFKKKKDFLVCVDSDGCAMDTMDVKHKECFGPCLVREWKLEKYKKEILERWNEINLYTVTRGINRFKGLALMLKEIDGKYAAIEGLEDLLFWAGNTREISNASIKKEIEKKDSACLKKALNWSLELNKAIDALSDDRKKPFSKVKETLEKIHSVADVAIVSSANRSAVIEEWTKYALVGSVDVILTQEDGDKAHCIGKMKGEGYGEGKILMVGDADGDRQSAEKNGVYFYPILVRRETESWQKLSREALCRFIGGEFGGEYQQSLIQAFYKNLGV